MCWGPAASKYQYQKTRGPLKKSWCTHFAWVWDSEWEIVINGEHLYVSVVKGFLSNFNETFPESCLHQHKLASHHFPILTPPTVQGPLHLIFANVHYYYYYYYYYYNLANKPANSAHFWKRLPSYIADFKEWMETNRFRNCKDTASFISIGLDINIVGPDLIN